MLAPMDPQPQDPHLPNSEASADSGKKFKFGCSGCLIVILGIILVGYILAFQSSIPVKMIAGSIEKNTVIDGRKLEIDGVGGSLSRGVKIKKLVIPGEHGDSIITGLKFRYKKPVRWFTRGQVTITEISCKSAEFVVANDFFDSESRDEEPSTDEEWEEEYEITSEDSLVTGDGFFDLKLLRFENARIRTVDRSVDVSIPLIHMKGLRIDRDNFKIDEFNIDSDVLSASLGGPGKAELDGKGVTFDQSLNMTIKPEIHEKVIRDIPLTFQFGMDKGRSATRVSAFGGAFEQADFADGRSRVRLSSLSPNDYLNFEGYIVPDDITMTAVQKGDQVSMEAGSFRIGKTTFTFEAREFEDSAEESMTGKATAGPYQVTAHVRPDKSDKSWPPMIVELSSQPDAPRKEILAQLYHGTDYDSLNGDQKAAIDKIK